MLWRTLVAGVLMVAGCSSSGDTMYVSAASSLTGPFSEIEAAFEDAHPDIDVVLNIAGSATLGYQISEGAPIDVFASADVEPMAGLEWSPFATNRLAIAVPAGNPGGVTGLDSLSDPALLVGACAVPVPCGRLADSVLEEASVSVTFATRDANVKAVLEKVAVGELDAGLVYVTDGIDDVELIAIETELYNGYPIAAISDRPESAEFVTFVLSSDGQDILRGWGFGTP